MAGSDKEFCIKCDKGGTVLSCSDSSCPISVHEKCLGFPAKFDDLGNFYCPYCSYRRATEESHLAWEKALLRKKALSSFIDMEMINGDEYMHEVGKSEQKELGRLHNTGKGNCNLSGGNENKLDQAVFQKHPIQPEEEREKDEIAPENAWRVSLHKEINTLLLGKQNNELSHKSGDNARPSKWNDRLVVVGHQTPSGPIVACGQDVSSEEEGMEEQFEMVQIGRWSQVEHHKQPYNDEVEETVENHTEDTHFSDIPLEENQQRENYFSSSAKDVDNDEDPIEEDKDHIEGKEETEEQVQESISSFATDPATPVALEEKEGFESADILCRGSNLTQPSKRGKISGHPSDISCSKISYRLSPSAPRANVEQTEEQTTPTELKQVAESSPVSVRNVFPSVRRKKLQWKDDEEEMLREGFQKYSSTGNKNIPWRKILQFGRHVFHDTRTPGDLKDKWRNMLAKER